MKKLIILVILLSLYVVGFTTIVSYYSYTTNRNADLIILVDSIDSNNIVYEIAVMLGRIERDYNSKSVLEFKSIDFYDDEGNFLLSLSVNEFIEYTLKSSMVKGRFIVDKLKEVKEGT